MSTFFVIFHMFTTKYFVILPKKHKTCLQNDPLQCRYNREVIRTVQVATASGAAACPGTGVCTMYPRVMVHYWVIN
jgi:hypothetical protein